MIVLLPPFPFTCVPLPHPHPPLAWPPAQQPCLPGYPTKWEFSCCSPPWLGVSGLELLAASRGKAPHLHVADYGDTRSVVSLFAQVAVAQVARPVLVPLGASSAYTVLPMPLPARPSCPRGA